MTISGFEWQAVAEGVFAAISRIDGPAVGNAAVIDIGGEAVVFDSRLSPVAARAPREVAETIGPIRSVVVSHWHADHSFGTSEFADCEIISTGRTRALTQTNVMAMACRARNLDRHELEERLEVRMAEAADELARAHARSEGQGMLAFFDRFEGADPTFPSRLFDQPLTIAGDGARSSCAHTAVGIRKAIPSFLFQIAG